MRAVLVVQGVYYLITGIWPLVSIATFEAVTGPKTDDWLVQTVGVLAAVIGATLLVGACVVPPAREAVTLSVLSILGFAAVDVVFVLRGTISPIYLADAAIQSVAFNWAGRWPLAGGTVAAAIGIAANSVGKWHCQRIGLIVRIRRIFAPVSWRRSSMKSTFALASIAAVAPCLVAIERITAAPPVPPAAPPAVPCKECCEGTCCKEKAQTVATTAASPCANASVRMANARVAMRLQRREAGVGGYLLYAAFAAGCSVADFNRRVAATVPEQHGC